MRMLGWRSGKVLACFEPSAGAEEYSPAPSIGPFYWMRLVDQSILQENKHPACQSFGIGGSSFLSCRAGPRPFSEALKSFVSPIDMPRPGSHDPARLVTAQLFKPSRMSLSEAAGESGQWTP